MSKIEYITNYLKNAKITSYQLKKICYCFAYDFTASSTSKEIGISRQTINSYYKMIREFLIDTQESYKSEDSFNKSCFYLHYIRLNTQIIYYIQNNETQYVLNDTNKQLLEIENFITTPIKKYLMEHKKANTARIMFHAPQNEYFISTYLTTSNDFETYLNTRLKKFRGLNKNNNILHIKESIIRYNTSKEFLYNTLSSIFK